MHRPYAVSPDGAGVPERHLQHPHENAWSREQIVDDPIKHTNFVTCRKRGSSLVRRLVQSEGDSAKQRIRGWLGAIDDERLLKFGLTPMEIRALRDPVRRI